MERTVLVLFDTDKGPKAQLGLSVEQAQEAAHAFAAETYAGTPTFDAWLLKSWWLMKDDGMPFFTPKPWPIAGVYDRDHMEELFDGKLPEWMVMLASDSNSFAHRPFGDKEEARASVVALISPAGGWAEENEAGGFTLKWKDSETDEVAIVGFIVAIAASAVSE